MIKIAVVDLSAESRARLAGELSLCLRPSEHDAGVIPPVSIKPLSPQEIRFNAAPDVCVAGPELAAGDLQEIMRIRKCFPAAAILVRLRENDCSLAMVDRLARAGVDDLISGPVIARNVLLKLLLLARRSGKSGSGQLLLVDSGKGGVGVTSLTAALGEALLRLDKPVVLIDLDFETQDLSRFLQSRPFINENLRLLLDEQRPVTEESVAECLVPAWGASDRMRVMPPAADPDNLCDTGVGGARIMLSILEVLDAGSCNVVVDTACVRGELRKLLYRVADKLVFVLNNDPATLYASADRITLARSLLSPTARTLVVENNCSKEGLSDRLLKKEFGRAARIDEANWASHPVPFCRGGCGWPASGGTLLSQSGRKTARAITALLQDLGLVRKKPAAAGLERLVEVIYGMPPAEVESAADCTGAPEQPGVIGSDGGRRLALPQPGRFEPSGGLNPETLISAPRFDPRINEQVSRVATGEPPAQEFQFINR